MVHDGSTRVVSNSLQFFSNVFSKVSFLHSRVRGIAFAQNRVTPRHGHRQIAAHSHLLIAFPTLLSIHSISPLSSIPQLPQSVDLGAAPSFYATATLPPPSLVTSTPGSIRVSNATYHPIRIALLPQIPPNQRIANTIQQVATSQQTELDSHDSNTHAEPVESPGASIRDCRSWPPGPRWI